MQKFCRDYIEFEQAVELSGYLSLEIDNYKKERYVLSEMVHSTGDVISESYCVKAFKTVKPSLLSKSYQSRKTAKNIHVNAKQMDIFGYSNRMVAHNNENLKDTLSHDRSHISTEHQIVCSGQSGNTNSSDTSVNSPAVSSSVKVSIANSTYPSIPSDPDQSEETWTVSHNVFENHIQPRKSIHLSKTKSRSLSENSKASCIELIDSNCNQIMKAMSTSENSEKTDHNSQLRGAKRNSPVTEISVKCKRERMVGDESVPHGIDEEASDVLSRTSLQGHHPGAELENLQLKEEDEIVCLDDVDTHTDVDKNFNTEQESFHMDTNIYLNHSAVAETNSNLSSNISNYEGYLSENVSSHSNLRNSSGRQKQSTSRVIHKCDLCSYKTMYTTHLRNHQKIHTREFVQCHLCPRKFADNSQLVYHLKVHAGRLTCPVCRKRFPSLKMMHLHQHLHTDGAT